MTRTLDQAKEPYIVAESLGTNGYRKWSSGYIEQWGTTFIAGDAAVTFPIAFPTACFGVVVTSTGAAATNAAVYTASTDAVAASTFNVRSRVTTAGSVAAASLTVSWVARGN